MQPERFYRVIALLVLAYCLIETVYVLRLPLVMDEFDGAYEAYHLRHAVPYRDFIPYKTVLGYFIETIPTFFATTVWTRIMAIKLFLVLINAAMLVLAAIVLSRFFARSGVCAALLLLIVSTNFLERSAELRVDMLTAWAGLVSLLFLLPRRYAASGIACGLSFLISQKAAIYFVAANVAILISIAIFDRSKRAVIGAISFNGGFALPLVAYVLSWSAAAPLMRVLRPTFFAAAGQALLNAYDEIRPHYWWQFVSRNPVYVALVIIAIVALLRKTRPGHALVAVYAAVILIEGVLYRQPWPYFFPLLLPAFFVLQAAFFDTVRMPRWGVAAVAIGSVLYPLCRVPIVLARNNDYQRYNVDLADAILDRSDTYLAGTDIVHDHEQAVPRLERLDGYNLQILRASPPAVLSSIVQQIDRTPPKLIVANYRIYGMPPPLSDYFESHYARLSASILCYAPLLPLGTEQVPVRFGGTYRIDTSKPGLVEVDGLVFDSGRNIELSAGTHTVRSGQALRLRLLPHGVEKVLDPQFVDERAFYPNIYDY